MGAAKTQETSQARSQRFVTKERARLEVYGHVGVLSAEIRNLSHTGAFLEMNIGDYIPQKGDLLNMTVLLDSIKREHHVTAEVVWSKDGDLGVCFINKDQVLERMMAKAKGI